jgi:hypothetical protein
MEPGRKDNPTMKMTHQNSPPTPDVSVPRPITDAHHGGDYRPRRLWGAA